MIKITILLVALFRIIYGIYLFKDSKNFSLCFLLLAMFDLLAYYLNKTICLIFFIIIIIVVLTDAYILMDNDKNTNPKYLLVLGNKLENDQISTILKYRLTKTIEFVKDRDVIIILCGGKTPNNNLREAIVMKDYLEKNKVTNKILLEDKSQTTIENIINALNEYPDIANEDVTILSSSYHITRAKLIAKKAGLKKVKGYSCHTPLNQLPLALFKERFCLLEMLFN